MATWICDGDHYLNENGELVEIHFDCDCESPRSWDTFTHFHTWTRSYNSPDECPYDSVEAWLEDRGIYEDEYYGQNPLRVLVDDLNKNGDVALLVSMAEHGSVAYSVGDPSQFVGAYPWDAGTAGIIYATRADIAKNFMVDEVTDEVVERAKELMQAEVETYSDWADGNCYYFVVCDRDGDVIDVCGGFIGSDAETNGITDHTGTLYDCEFISVEDYVDSFNYDEPDAA